jgi:hypothetical protein
MSDLDTQLLRRALRAPEEPGRPAPRPTGPDDLTEIITRGRRLRWRRRAMAAGGSLCLAAAVVGAVAGIGRLTAPSSGPAQHVVTPAGPTRARLTPAPSPGRGRATPSPIRSATAAPTASPTTPSTTLPTGTPTQPHLIPTPTPTRSAPVNVSASSEVSASSTPSAAASDASTNGGQPSASPSASG